MITTPETIEREIYKVFSKKGDPQSTAQKLYELFENSVMPLDCFEILAQFYITANSPFLLIKLISQRISRNLEIPWAHFLHALKLTEHEFSEKFWLMIEKGIIEHNAEKETSRLESLPFTPSAHLFKQIDPKVEFENKILQKYHYKLDELWSQVHMLKTQELYEPAENIIEEIKKIKPHDSRIAEYFSEQKSRLIKKVVDSKYERKITPYFYETADHETTQSVHCIQNEMLAVYDKTTEGSEKDQLAKDFSILFLFIDWHDLSLYWAERLPATIRNTWHQCEILFLSRKYIELISLLEQLESHTKEIPDLIFSIEYLRAQCWNELGQKLTAIETMERILNQRPNYRSASLFLELWRRGEL